MPLAELTGTYKGDISAALKKSTDDKVTPLMTPLSRRSVRIKSAAAPKSSNRPLITTSNTVAKLLAQPTQPTGNTSSSAMMDVDAAPTRDFKLNIFEPSAISTLMAQPMLTDVDKLAMIDALKKQLALVEKSIPASRPQ